MKRLKLLTWLLLLTLSAAQTQPLCAAQDDRAKDAELRRKAEEVERLKDELSRAQGELKRLKQDNERLRQEQPRAAKPTAAPAPPPKPVPPVATLPALKPGELIEADALAGHFRTEPEAARQRFVKQVLRVRGEIARFDPKLVRRRYDVVLETGDRQTPLVCEFDYAAEVSAVYVKESGQALVARKRGTTEFPLFQVGQTVVIEGSCWIGKNGQVHLLNSRVVRAAP